MIVDDMQRPVLDPIAERDHARSDPGRSSTPAVRTLSKAQKGLLSERPTEIDSGARAMSMNARSAVGTCRRPG
jgi:hypothetical protein